ncbi:MAG: methyltransferase [Pseudomonadota bacterium]
MPAPASGQRERGLAGAFARWRNGLIASPRFQRFAARFPLTRPVANAQAARLFDLTAGFVYSQVLAALVRLDLLERLAPGPMTAAEAALGTPLDAPAMTRLLEAATGIDLVEPATPAGAAARWRLSGLGAALRGNPGALAMIRHHEMLYRDLADPVAALARRGAGPDGSVAETARFWAYARDPGGRDKLAQAFGPEAVSDYSALMAASQQFIAEDVLDRLPLTSISTWLDIGGGEGAFLAAAAARAPHLRLGLVDLPAVAARAKARFERLGLGDRAEIVGGDFFTDAMPFAAEGGAATVSLVRVLYDHDDAEAVAILRRAREVIAPGGRLVIAEPMAELPGARGVGAYFTLYLQAMGSGRLRSPAALIALAREAGFRRARSLRTARPILCGLVTAHR